MDCHPRQLAIYIWGTCLVETDKAYPDLFRENEWSIAGQNIPVSLASHDMHVKF